MKDLSEAYSNDEESLYKRDVIFTEVSFTLNKCSIVLKSSKATGVGKEKAWNPFLIFFAD